MVRVVLNLTNNQVRKLNSGKAFQLSHSQLMGQGGDHQVELDVERKLGNKIHRSSINGKGFRIPKGLVSAGVNLAKANSGKIANYAANQGATMLKNQLANSSYVPASMKGELANSLIDMGVNNIKTRGLNEVNSRLSQYNGKGFGNFVKAMKKVAPVAKVIGKIALPMAGTMAGTMIGGPMGAAIGSQLGKVASNGLGLPRRPVKGSAEAKAHMARIRAMRGKGLMGSLKKAGKMAQPYAQDAVKRYGADAVALIAKKTGLVDPNVARQLTQGAIKMSGMGIKPRYKPSGRILLNGIDLPVPGQVFKSGMSGIDGSGFGGWGYES